jgi:hypothetical protein
MILHVTGLGLGRVGSWVRVGSERSIHNADGETSSINLAETNRLRKLPGRENTRKDKKRPRNWPFGRTEGELE